jgi:putative redox protein
MKTTEMQVSFPGGKRVDAHYGGFTVKTDQSRRSGGDASAPAPYTLFLASIATCAGIYVLSFLQARKLPVEGAGLVARFGRDEQTGALQRCEIEIRLPPGFPAKYRRAIERAANECAVERAIVHPELPKFVVRAVEAGG